MTPEQFYRVLAKLPTRRLSFDLDGGSILIIKDDNGYPIEKITKALIEAVIQEENDRERRNILNQMAQEAAADGTYDLVLDVLV